MKSLLPALALIAAAIAPLHADPEPESPGKHLGANDLETRHLYEEIANSKWEYHWRHSVVEIRFGPDGDMIKAPWGDTTWRITGPHTIVFTSSQSKSGDMVAHLNPEFTRWTCVDWSKNPAFATRVKTKEGERH